MKRLLALTALLLVTAILYVRRLDYVPAHLGFDEVYFALNAHSIATTGRGTDGTFLPLYFYIGPLVWYQPLKREVLAFAAAALMAVTPAHYLMSRQGLDYILPVPYILVWLWCLASFANRPRPWLIAGSAAALGFGFYTYMASVLMMPIYFAMTVAFVLISAVKPKTRYLVEAMAFVVPLLPLAPWLVTHPTAYADQIARYHIYDVNRFSPLQGAKEFVNYVSLQQRIAMYWGYLGPNYLFVSGGIKMTMTTRRVGVFLMPLAVFLPVGIYQMLTKRSDPFGRLLVAGFLTAPAAALLIDDAFAIDREMNMLPFGVLLATFGIGCLIDSGRRWVRVMAIVLLALMPVEFAYFYKDYFGDYRARSAEWFAPNVRGGLEAILAREDPAHPARIYLDLEIGNVENYWTFYLIKHRRADLKAQTTYIRSDSFDARTIPSHSFVFTEAKAQWHRDLVARKELSPVLAVPEAGGGDPLYVLLQRP